MQFGLTTIYHFPFIPITVGMATTTAVFQTAWCPPAKVTYLHLTQFFGMNWSTYSRFVGDVFGAPLAMEGLLAFFLEATFIGLWIFG